MYHMRKAAGTTLREVLTIQSKRNNVLLLELEGLTLPPQYILNDNDNNNDNDLTLMGTDEIRIFVEFSDPVVTIKGGNDHYVRVGRPVILDASETYDPSITSSASSPLLEFSSLFLSTSPEFLCLALGPVFSSSM